MVDRMLKKWIPSFERYDVVDRMFYLILTFGFWASYLEYKHLDSFLVAFLFTFLIISVLVFSRYYNKTLYILITAVFLGLVWFITLMKISLITNNWLWYLGTSLISLGIIIMSFFLIKTWETTSNMIIYYEKLLKMNPQDIVAWNNKGVYFIAQNKTISGMECFNKALEIDPDDAVALYNKGVLMKKEDPSVSQKYINKALKLDPGLKRSKKANYLILNP